LEWPTKPSADRVRSAPAAPIERLAESAPDPASRLIHGENAGALRALRNDLSVRGKVRLIYIDPPYATGRAFASRDQADAYDDGVVGDDYLSFLYERLVLLRDLLAEDGSIYVHLDQNMAFEAKLLMDELFGRANFRNFVTRQKCSRKNYTRKQYGNVSDHLLFYSMSDRWVWNRALEPWTEAAARREYPNVDDAGRRYKKVPIHAPGLRNGASGRPWRGNPPPPGKHWQYTPERLDEMDAAGQIYWSSNGNPRRKIYFDDSLGLPIQDVWVDTRDPRNQNARITGYATEKSLPMLNRVVAASSNPGDLVLDAFCGSGTTLEAAESLGRRWIGIDAGEAAIDTTLDRLLAGRERMGDFVGRRRAARDEREGEPVAFALEVAGEAPTEARARWCARLGP